MKRSARSKWSSLVARACLDGRLPDDACGWPFIEVVGTTVLRGGGESTSWHGYVTVRRDGKQIWRGTDHDYEYCKPLAGMRLLPAGKDKRSEIYVEQP